MTRYLTVSIADSVYNRIEQLYAKKKANNKSQMVEEILRIGLDFEEQKADEDED